MNPRISIDFAVAEGAVQRMLGFVERRGYQVCGIGMIEHEDKETAVMMLEVVPRDASRQLDVLELQLWRLQGVCGVTQSANSARIGAL